MKKLFFGLIAMLVAFASCEKDPDLDKVQDQNLVYTQYDKSANFSSYKTFYIPDSILLIGTGQDTATYWTNANAKTVVNAFVTDMKARGYVQSDSNTDADLGIQVSFFENTQYVNEWWGGNYPWLDYPYWSPSYWWPSWSGWYYPYAITYSFTTGTLMGEIVDLKAASTGGKTKGTVIWSSFVSGYQAGPDQVNVSQLVSSVNQAFSQSPYLKTTASK